MNRIDGEMVIVLNIECGMSWVRPPVGSNQSRTIKLVCIASPLGMPHVPRTGLQFLFHTWHPSALSRCTPVSTINKGDRHDGCKIIFCRSLCFSPHFSFPCCGVVLLCFVCPRSMFCSQCCMFLSALSILDCSMPPSHSDKDHAECSTS